MRQQGPEESQFRDVLSRLSNGTFSKPDWEWLQSQSMCNFDEVKKADFRDTATMLCARKVDCKKQNIYRIKSLNNPIAPIQAVNNCAKAKSAEPSTAGGLFNSTLLAVGAQMILTTNVWKEAGLTNGTLCEVREIVYRPGTSPPQLPIFVLVHVPDYKGPSFSSVEPSIVPIAAIERNWNSQKQFCKRSMIPLQPAYALSIHKSQGMSLPKIIANLWHKEFSQGLTYVALSRCTKISNLALEPFPTMIRFIKMFKSKAFLSRKEEDDRLKQVELLTIERGFLGDTFVLSQEAE